MCNNNTRLQQYYQGQKKTNSLVPSTLTSKNNMRASYNGKEINDWQKLDYFKSGAADSAPNSRRHVKMQNFMSGGKVILPDQQHTYLLSTRLPASSTNKMMMFVNGGGSHYQKQNINIQPKESGRRQFPAQLYRNPREISLVAQ